MHIAIDSALDIVTARHQGRVMATELGFAGSELTLIATVISEVARNIVDHAKHGEVVLRPIQQDNRHGIGIMALDEGPGIPDLAKAMEFGYSTRQGLGMGLPGAKLLMDEFEIESQVGRGTRILMKKWRR